MFWKSFFLVLGILFITIGLPTMIPNSIRIGFFILGNLIIISVVIYQIYESKFRKKSINNKTELQNIFGKIATLYSQTGILIQNSFDIPIATIGGESQSLHKNFQDFTKYMDTITLSLPQEVGVKIMSLFDLLSDYKKQADVIINSSKTNECYARWLDLKQRHEKIVAPRYTELEVYLRNILNEKNST
ncbi:unnamed protein product [marine sediment metagenome]|uniref:Uncharacterized protein n=1 Tax=marine sediment metagenome TaxID=412755 RepID=X0V109_9ZZZZ